MKRFFTAAILLLAVSLTTVPMSAQKLYKLDLIGKFGKSPVQYSDAKAYTDGRGVWIGWQTERETKNLGFYVYRVGGGERQLLNTALVPGAYARAQAEQITSGSYSYYDRFGDANSNYIVESYNLNGQKIATDLIQPQVVNDLKDVAGSSSEQLFNQSKNAKPEVLRNDLILPKDLAEEVESNNAQADPVTQKWVAAQAGAKIGVKNEGFYRVSRADLQTGGFDVTAPTERWQLYVNGVEQAINVGADGSYIEFYGKGIDTLESNTQTYFLVVGTQNGKRIGTTIRRQMNGAVLSQGYSQSFLKKERLFYAYNVLNGDAENFFGTFLGTSGATVNFNLSNVDFNSPTASIDLTINGATLVPHQNSVSINNVPLGVIQASNYAHTTTHFDIPTSVLLEGTNTLQFASTPASGDGSYFDSVKVNFSRKYVADQGQLSFYVPNYKASYVENFASLNVRLFDTTNSDNPTLISGLTVEQSGAGYRVYIPSNRGRMIYAVEDAALAQPSWIVPNAPSTLSTAANNGEMIIISYKDWLPQAEDWANYRRSQGMTVKVVNIDDVYDEFNYGVLNSLAIRSFLQYAKTNWQTPPNYVLLLGDATYDPKNYTGIGIYNFVPTKLVDTVYSETGSDETLADFNDDGLAEIPIGRIPARNAATVTLALNKEIAFEQTVSSQGLNRGAVFAYDLPNGYDFQGLSGRLRDQLPTTIPRILVGREMPNAQTQLLSELNNGRFLVNYSGHGNAGVWASSGFFNNTNAGALNNGNNLSIYTMLTCLNGYFIQENDAMGEILLKNPNGGAVSAWASTGLTTADVQEVMATRYYNQIAAGNITRLGDLIRDAKTTISYGRDVRLSWTLLGDPTLKTK
ncbi:MAG: C25 family cysteine peptidase [Pyrinomonadaceae bacterium]